MSTSGIVLLALGLCGGSAAAADALVRYPDYPAAIGRDAAYRVSVRQGETRRELTVYNHCEQSALAGRTRGGDVSRRFCEFAFAGAPVTVDIAVHEDVRCYKVFPARRRLAHTFADGVISVTLTEPCCFGVQLNDADKTILSVFADAPERAEEIPARDAPGVMYVEGWVDAPAADGLLPVPAEVREIYLAPGSVLNARLKLATPRMRLHGRGMVLDPMSDVFRFDQSRNPSRGLVRIVADGVTVEDVKLIDARTFNFVCRGDGCVFRNVKVMASMMCSDGFTNGGRDLLVDNAWVYVGDNALVVSGVRDAVYRNVAIGTSCKAVFPQGTNRNVQMANIDVFRADEGVIANVYNGALRRKNKWSEMGTGLQRREPGPQDLPPQAEEFSFDTLSAVDATYVGYVFRGRDMGCLPKTFAFRNLSVPHVPGCAGWQGIGRTNGVSIAVDNDPKRWLVTGNYALTVTNLYLAGRPAEAFPAFAVRAKDAGELKLAVVRDDSVPRTVPLGPDRVEVGWRCPAGRRLPPPVSPANLLTDNRATRSIWQRCPSWLVKFDACRRGEGGEVIYRLYQCEKGAGLLAVLTERVQASGFGLYRLSFEAKAEGGEPFGLRVTALSNERRNVAEIAEIDRSGSWRRYETTVDFGFDPAVTELAALALAATAPADEVCFRNFALVRLPEQATSGR
ncbi:MAG: hypothetical protein ACI4RD_05255 [Kiritimatiellia bacterium]